MNKRWYRAFALTIAVAWLTAAGMARGQETKPTEGAAAQEPPANQWVKIGETPRLENVSLVYAPNVKRFVMVTPEGVRHFDLASKAWKNAPVGGKWPNLKTRRGTYFQVAWDPGSAKIVSYLGNRTWSLDPKTWALADRKASPSPAASPRDLLKEGELRSYNGDHSHLIWGSLCVDPVNNEALLLGGASAAPEGTPGFWRYSFEKNAWARDASASEDDQRRTEAIKALEDETWNLLSRVRNRFHAAETDEEAKADLAAAAETAAKAIDKVRATEKNARAATKLEAAAAALRRAMPSLGEKPDLAVINTLLAGHRRCFEAGLLTASTPSARLNAQMAYDASAKKIVLFGGDGWDRLYGDTWVYDCATRRWEQRFPESAPAPRAGSALVYLPKSKKILLVGGYAYGSVRDGYQSVVDQWIYDTVQNRWTRIADPKPTKADRRNGFFLYADNVPVCGPACRSDVTSVWPAAADENDNVALVGSGMWRPGVVRIPTWLCRVVPDEIKPVAQPDKAPPLVAYRNWIQGWDRHGPADREKQANIIRNLEPNVWVNLSIPRDAIQRDYGTTAYDTRRRQMLYWGGGHSSWMGSDIHHWSLRGGLWSQSYDPDINLNFTRGFLASGFLTFRNRPQIPIHGYQTYAYDPVADLMVVCHFKHTFTYDVARREWIGAPFRPPFTSNAMRVSLATTPHGVVAWADKGLFLFDGKARAWKKLPLSGGNPGTPWCDGSGLCYDDTRDCLWLGGSSAHISKYDMKTGKLARFTGGPAALKDSRGRHLGIREMSYVADQDLVLFVRLKKRGGKTFNYCFDAKDGKWYWLELPYRVGDKASNPAAASWWTCGSLNYDQEAKVVMLSVGPRAIERGGPKKSRVWLLKLDRKTAKMTPIVDPKSKPADEKP
jgi:hypothetical protein